MSVVGTLADDTDPMVSVMKVEKAPTESYADIGGLHEQVLYLILRTCSKSIRSKKSKKQWNFP